MNLFLLLLLLFFINFINTIVQSADAIEENDKNIIKIIDLNLFVLDCGGRIANHFKCHQPRSLVINLSQ